MLENARHLTKEADAGLNGERHHGPAIGGPSTERAE
jgi:hypothetical protein